MAIRCFPLRALLMPLATLLLLVTLLLTPLSTLQAADHMRVGVLLPTLSNPFWQNYTAFIQEIAKQLEIEVEVVDFHTDERKQLVEIKKMINKRLDGLIITPQTVQIGPALITLAQKAKIPLVVTDRWPGIDPRNYSWDGYVGFIGPDDVDTGYRIAKTLIQQQGRKRLIALNGVRGASVAEGRYQGLKQALQEHPDVRLLDAVWVGETKEKGQQAMRALLPQYEQHIDGVWCYNDALALGALAELKQPGTVARQHAMDVVGMDLIPGALEKITQGEMLASFGGHWMQGGFGLIMLYDYLHSYQPNPDYKVVKLKLLKVTKQNVKQFKQQFIDAPPRFSARSASMALNPEATGKYFFEIELK
uniref:Putative Periplasmic binding protein/LacI transcriptional regulator. D-ribose-binding protein n=1 Tax=Magnetococcus massalia (strain MO-1) TaxID=451514 RepID=A0A1S7LEB6_MAGMO|nr:Putative Periplasmic binding protein/LacI transcriptional regulator. D-ribose-binding protein [Candidatus Magnetococcus massalia]